MQFPQTKLKALNVYLIAFSFYQSVQQKEKYNSNIIYPCLLQPNSFIL